MVGTRAGKYQIVEFVGRGSMGTVYRAQDTTLHRDVAIKALNADVSDPAASRRFHAEAIAIARLNHQGIAKVFDLFEHDGQWLMAMELVVGETLESLVIRSGPLPAERAADLMSQALAALVHAHGMGVVHRDLKPANLMVADGRLKVMDFGIARVAGSEHLTSVGFLMGTPAYMAPEQLLGHEVDARTDVFAIGCVMYFLATAKLPFKGETAIEIVESRLHDAPTPVRSFRDELPEWFAQVVARALAKDPIDRYQTAAEYRDAIGRGLAGLSVAPPEAQPTPAVSSAMAETMIPGVIPVIPSSGGTSAGAATAIAETTRTPATAMGPSNERPLPAKPPMITTPPMRIVAGAVAIVLAVASAAWWFWPRGTVAVPPVDPLSTSVTQSAEVSAQPPPADPAVTATPTPTVIGARGGAAAPTPAATPGPRAVPSIGAAPARGAKVTETPVSFALVKWLKVTGRRGEDVDATLTFGGGLIAVDPHRDQPRQSLQYDGVMAATFVKDRDPRWAPTFAGPPADLDVSTGLLPTGLLRRRNVRNWLVLQGKAFYIVLSLSDADSPQVLATLAERTRVKIDQPGPVK